MASKRIEIAAQNDAATFFNCPKCGRLIHVRHGDHGVVNDGIGRLDRGDQKYFRIVCFNRRGVYCDWAGDVEFIGDVAEVVNTHAYLTEEDA